MTDMTFSGHQSELFRSDLREDGSDPSTDIDSVGRSVIHSQKALFEGDGRRVQWSQ